MLQYLPELLKGLPLSLSLMFCSLMLALLLAFIFTAILTVKLPFFSQLIKGYITVLTGTPLLVQIFLIYYGPGQFNAIKEIPFLWNLLSEPWFCAMLALALNSSAYTTVLFYGAMKAIPEGQWEACRALGLSNAQSLRIMFPYAIKRALSSYSNEVVLIFKSTSLAYTITLMEIMGQSKYLYGNNYDLSVFVDAGIIYLVVNSLLTIMMRKIERHALRFEQR